VCASEAGANAGASPAGRIRLFATEIYDSTSCREAGV
jgi:hypothetical protein